MAKIKRLPYLFVAVVIIFATVIGYGGWAYARILPSIEPVLAKTSDLTAKPVNLTWPTYGQAAISATGYGQLGVNGSQTPVPIASVAKIITALTVLKAKPLAINQTGPTLTLGDTDIAYYQYYLNNNGSISKVANGEQINQYQALQALLLPSSNNMADSLAYWSFGSQDKYVSSANSMLTQMGATHTHIADASGFSADTTSTASDLILIGQAALDNPVIADIVTQTTAEIPVAGIITNVNSLVGTDGIIGIKTGNTDQAGGCLLFAGRKDIAPGKTVTVIGAILGAPSLGRALGDTLPLLDSAYAGFSLATAVKAGLIMGSYQTPWGVKVNAIAKNNLQILHWNNDAIPVKSSLKKIKVPAVKNSKVGDVTVIAYGKTVTSPIVLSSTIPSPSWYWRVRR